jgi:NAD+ kinase
VNFGVYTNLTKDLKGLQTQKVCNSINNLLKNENDNLFLSNDLKNLGIKAQYLTNEDLFKLCNVVVLLGGDGTILRVAELASKYKTKILALNLGSRGFLTEIPPNDLDQILKDILSKNYCLDERFMIQAKINKKVYIGLNDVVVSRGDARAGRFCVYINGFLVDKYSSDGVIISTPTGSTAYNLSSGGPILAPDVSALVITPIAAHSLHTRPLVTNSNNVIKININSVSMQAQLNVDGIDVCKINQNEDVEITKSKNSLLFIRTVTYNYYDRFLNKLLNWIII